MGASPQQKLNDLFLKDTYGLLQKEDYDALDAVARLRLYIAVTGYGKGLRELYFEGGFSSAQYDALLARYNRQLAKKL